MIRSKSSFLPKLALGLVFFWAATWAVGLLWGGGPVLRIGALLAGLVAAVAAVVVARRYHRIAVTLVQRHFEVLCHVDPYCLPGDTAPDLPPLPEGGPWLAIAEQVRQSLREYGRRLSELEHARAGLEIRSRRATHQCERIRAVLCQLGDPIVAVDEFGEVVLANPAAEKLFHFDAGQVEQRVLGQILQCQRLIDLVMHVSHSKAAIRRSDELEIPDGDGRPQWYQASAIKLTAEHSADAEMTDYGTAAVLVDIGQQKALQKRNAEFISSVSHEMKAPLAGIKAYVELLVDGDAEDHETREEFLNVINGQADRLQRLVDNMLNLARIEAGVVKVNKESRSLNDLLEESLRVIQPAAEAKDIELVTELSPLYLGVFADRDMLLQAAINLLSNAVKYTAAGGRVALRSRAADDRVAFEVEDTGVGLSPQDCQRIFEKFYRVDKDKNMASGTGLGLALAKHIVEDVHGGTLTVESTLGVGSKFIASLPSAGKIFGESARPPIQA